LVRAPLVFNAGYSFMAPGATISPHTGYTGDVLRFHLGLICPEGDCALRVGKEQHGWKDREAFLFDDTEEHEAWNRTEYGRLIIIADLRRDQLL
jgi:aspartyl/asparaginyl beta-hydroxylase (cupin superfamily)